MSPEYSPLSKDQPPLIDQIVFGRVASDAAIDKVWNLMAGEFMKHGGNLRDISLDNLKLLASNEEIWSATTNDKHIAAFTLTKIYGDHPRPWVYINHGVVESNYRHLGIMDLLLREGLGERRDTAGYIVISVVRRLFDNLGFVATNVEDLKKIDGVLSEVIRAKIRPEKITYIYLRETT